MSDASSSTKSQASRLSELEKATSSLRKQVTGVAVLGLVLGGGGLLGFLQFAYGAPTDVAKTKAETKLLELDATIKQHEETIESLERSLGRVDPDDPTIAQLNSQLENAEMTLRNLLQQFNSSELSMRSIRRELEASKELVAATANDIRGFTVVTAETKQSTEELVGRVANLQRSLDRQQRTVASALKEFSIVKSSHSDLLKVLKDNEGASFPFDKIREITSPED